MLKRLVEGRVVHYVLSEADVNTTSAVGRHRPAIVVETWPQLGREDGYANLIVFMEGTNDGPARSGAGHTLWVTSRVHSTEKKPGTWHWPEQA